MSSENFVGDVHKPTFDLIMCAFPGGIPENQYMTLLSILIEHISIRVLSRVVAKIRGGQYYVYMNDVVNAKSYKCVPEVEKTVKDKLLSCGYEDWLEIE